MGRTGPPQEQDFVCGPASERVAGPSAKVAGRSGNVGSERVEGPTGKVDVLVKSVHARGREINISLPNNQRQHRTLHIQKDVLPFSLC